MRSPKSRCSTTRHKPMPNDWQPVDEAPTMNLVVTARPTAGDVILGLDRKTDVVQMDPESAMKVAYALLDAVMLLEDEPDATRQ